jgi:hypothetical protein
MRGPHSLRLAPVSGGLAKNPPGMKLTFFEERLYLFRGGGRLGCLGVLALEDFIRPKA